MIEVTKGNLLEDGAEALVNTVNTVGVMGKGIALQFKQAFPENFKVYKKACDAHELHMGEVFIVTTGRMLNPKYIINFPTKKHWRGKSKLSDIRAGLQSLVAEVKRLNIKSIAVPPLGCGNGGLDWSEVSPLVEEAFKSVPDVLVHLYAPYGPPDAETMPVRTEKAGMTRARALFVRLIEQYSIPGYRLTLLELQKLAYFLQEAGENLRLRFVKHLYGPYAENLNHVLQRIEGHFIRGYGDRSHETNIHLLPSAATKARDFLLNDPTASERLGQVGRLIEGFESPYGMELLSTVHWVATKEDNPARDVDDAVRQVYEWSDRKKIMKPSHIQKALQRLGRDGWL